MRYIATRLLSGVLVIFGVSTIVFFLSHLTGDPASLLLGPGATPEQIAEVNRQWGYDRPMTVQYVDFLGKAMRGDFGQSLWQREPAIGLVLKRFPLTLALAAAALALSLGFGVPAGIVAASRRGSYVDRLTTSLALLGQSMPVFWVGIMLILLFAVQLRWFPSSGVGGWKHLVLPAVGLSFHSVGRVSRLTRSQMLEALGKDYIRTAYAKGLRRWIVLYKHALRNAAGPLITTVGIEAGTLLGGAIVTETVFALPGTGNLMVTALFQRDFPLIQAGVLWVAVVFVTITTLVDVVQAMINPTVVYR